MSTQVERLQALLERVEHNRQKPRPLQARPAPSAAAQPAARSTPEAAAPVAPVPAPAREVAATKPTAPGFAAQAAPARPPAPSPQRQVVVQEVVAPPRVSRAAEPAAAKAPPAASGPSLLVDPVLDAPSKPIAQVVSKHPPSTPLSFGDLLRRSLSARPR
ncbi:MAG: hypothetical protein ACHQ53_13755 [Polyangiales bacterium]